MKTNSSLPTRLSAAILGILLVVQTARAQVSEVVATDDAGGTQAAFSGGITSLDFHDNGLFWTVFGGNCSGEFTVHPSVATLGFRNRPFSAEYYNVRGCPPSRVGGAVRDDAYIFYTTPQGVNRKAVGAGESDPSRTIGLFWGDLNPGAMMLYNGRAYYSYHSPGGQISGGRGYFVIEYFDMPGAGGILQPVVEVSHGGGLPNTGRIKKMGVIGRRIPGLGPDELAYYGLALTDQGSLLLFFLDQTIPQWRAASVIATGVTDFAVRREQFIDPDPFRLFYEEDQLYASIGTSYCPADPPARLVTIDPISRAISTVWTAPDGYISAIGVDAEYIFVSTYGRRALGGPFGGCERTGNGVIRSKCLPASIFGACRSGVDPNWNAIEPFFAGENLRSDGRFLYFTRGKEVRRMPNNSPPVVHDFANLGFEVVQVVQDLNNSVRLVEGKRTVLRAYARVASSTLAQTDWYPTAQLRGWRNGVELPGPLYAMNSPRITAEGSFAVLRPNMNRSFQFELPPEWVRSGRLTLRFTVNPHLALYESGANPLGNNSGEQGNLAVVQVQPPCFVFASMHSTTAPNYWPWENADDFARIMERAKSMLPVPDIHIHPTTERVSDERICLRVCNVLGLPVPCGFVCNDPFDFSKKEDWDEALEELAAYDGFDQNRPGCGRTHYVGAIHPAAMNLAWGGYGETPGTRFIASMRPDSLSAENSPWPGRTIAHEFGHNLNRRHINQKTSVFNCGGNAPDKPDPLYPNDTCTIGQTNLANVSTPLGFDMISFRPILSTNAADLMSYADNRWPSIYTYNAMLDALSPTGPAFAAAGAPAPGPHLLVRGVLKLAQGTARLKGCYTLPNGIADPAKVQASLAAAAAQGAHGYFIRKLDGAGAVLEETPLIVREADDANEDAAVIHQFITKPAGMAGLQIVRNGAVLAESRATPGTPVVNAVAAVYDATGPSLQVSFDAADADNDPLLFSVQFSNDDGATWRTLRANEGAYSFTAGARFLPGGTQCRVRVIATDGFNSATGVSEAFELPGRAPEPSIGGVRDGQRLPFGTRESLLGFALDAEDGSLPAERLTWVITGPVVKSAAGSSISLQALPPGIYTANLTVSDADNNPAVAAITFEILPMVIEDASTPVLDGDANDAAYANAAVISPILAPQTKVRFVHAGGNLYASFSDLPYGGPVIRGRIGLYVDADGSGDAAAQAGDLAFFVDEDGVPLQYAGDGAQMQLVANPSSGFKAVISRGQAGWNAEFRIAESLLGGWNHAARLAVFDQSATTIFVFGIPIDTPVFAGWPDGMLANNPSTWAPVWFGNVPPPLANQPPVAHAGAPQFVDARGPTTAALHGGASFDPDGDPLTYAWTQLDGPSVALDNQASAVPSFNADVATATLFRFQLIVSDGQLDSLPAEVEVTLVPAASQQVPLPPATQRNDDGSISVGLHWPGRPGDQTVIQASSDLETWEDLAVETVGLLPVLVYNDAQAGLFPQRFYRLAGAPESPNSAAGTALKFDGVNDRVRVPHDAELNAFPLTVAAWVKTTQNSAGYVSVANKYVGGSGNGYSLHIHRGRLAAFYFRGNGTSSIYAGDPGFDGGFIADGQWHHVALVIDETGGRIHVDGVLTGALGWTGAPGACTTTTPLTFGWYPLGGQTISLDGSLDELSVWSRALNTAEIGALMQFKSTGAEPDLLGFWPLDDGAGETATDLTGRGHDAVLENGPVWIPSTAPIYP